MAAGGVIVPPPGYWQRIQENCRRHDIFVVADEMITGFGRLGAPFGCDVFGIEPDIMVVSKQLTSSYQPLAAVILSEKDLCRDRGQQRPHWRFGTWRTAGGHPVATAVALENLRVIEERSLVANAAEIGEILQARLQVLANHPLVGEVRGLGLIAGLELVADKRTKRPFDPVGRAGAIAFAKAQEHGLIVRNIQDTIALCPPLIVSAEQVGEIVRRLERALDDTFEEVHG